MLLQTSKWHVDQHHSPFILPQQVVVQFVGFDAHLFSCFVSTMVGSAAIAEAAAFVDALPDSITQEIYAVLVMLNVSLPCPYIKLHLQVQNWWLT